MKSIFYLFLTLIIVFSCNSTQTEPTTPAVDSTQTEPTTPVTTTSESFKTNSPYAAEIKKIDEEVAKIEAQLASYKKDQKEKNGCKIAKYLDKDGLDFKIMSSCQDGAVWSFYMFKLGEKTNKIMYVKYEKAGVVQESYSIGCVVAGPETFGLQLDEKGNKMEGEAYSTFEQLQETAYIGTM